MTRKPVRLPLFISREEMDLFMKIIRRDRHRVAFALMIYAGLRVSEVCTLKLSQVNLVRSFIRVKGKGGRERIVPLTSRLHGLIETYCAGPARHFTGENHLVGGNRRSWHDMCKKYARLSLGRTDVHCHTLRHSFATRLYDEGVQLERIAQILGHARLDTTLIYAHISLQQKQEAVSVLDHPARRFFRWTRFFAFPARHLAVRPASVFIGREKEVRSIEQYLSQGHSVIVSGPAGCGKSAILKEIKPANRTVIPVHEFRRKQTLVQLALAMHTLDDEMARRAVEKELRKLSIDELINSIASPSHTIVIDDITELTRADRKIIQKLAERMPVVAASSRIADRKLFRTFVEVQPLKRHEQRVVIAEMIAMNNAAEKERIVNDILHAGGGNIREAVYVARQMELGKTADEISTDERAANQVSIAPALVIVVLFFAAYVLKSYATSMVALSYALLVVFRLVFYRYIFTPAISRSKTT